MNKLQTLFNFSLLSLIIINGFVSCQSELDEKPNVIVVITDDQGYGDLACHGNPIIQTPNLDDLYGESIRLTNFHVGTTCAPTRAALMTGRNCNRTGVWHTIGGCSILNKDETTIAEILSQNGYETGMFGKWHLGDSYPFRPQDRGFDEAFYHGGGGIGQTPDYWMNDYFDDTYFRNGIPEQARGYCTDVWFSEALSFIEKNRDMPFFCYLSPNAPHSPFNVPQEYYNIYKNEKELLDYQKRFYGMISNLDENMGKLIKSLEEWNIANNTILIFMTDNGTSAGFKTEKETGKVYGYNAGMKGTKGMPDEGGHRVPFFIHWPKGGIVGGKDIDQLTAHVDVLPTLTALCNLDYQSELPLDGVNLGKLLKAEIEKLPSRILITDTQRLQWPRKGKSPCVMQDKWRLIRGNELYNLANDPGQENNLSEKFPKKTKKMQEYYDEWWSNIENDFKYSWITVGTRQQNPVEFTCHDAHASDQSIPWNQQLIREGVKNPFGYFYIEVKKSGNYLVELSRWPFESGLPINSSLPPTEAKGYLDGFVKGRSLSYSIASMQIDEKTIVTTKVDNNQQFVKMNCNINAGRHHIKFYFEKDDGTRQGAYFIRMKILE